MFKVIKTVSQVVLLIAGIAMVCVGVARGEAAIALGKTVRLCLGCIEIG